MTAATDRNILRCSDCGHWERTCAPCERARALVERGEAS